MAKRCPLFPRMTEADSVSNFCYVREGSGVEVSKTILHLGWKFHSIGFLISKFEFWRRFLAGKFKFTNKKSDGMEFPFQMRIIFETSTRDPSLADDKNPEGP